MVKKLKKDKKELDKLKTSGIINNGNDYLAEITTQRESMLKHEVPKENIITNSQFFRQQHSHSTYEKLLERSNAILYTRRVIFADMFDEFPNATEFNPWADFWIHEMSEFDSIRKSNVQGQMNYFPNNNIYKSGLINNGVNASALYGNNTQSFNINYNQPRQTIENFANIII